MKVFYSLLYTFIISVLCIATEDPALVHYQSSINKVMAVLKRPLPPEINYHNFKQYGNSPLKNIYVSNYHGINTVTAQRMAMYKNHLHPSLGYIHSPQDPEVFNNHIDIQSNNTIAQIVATIRNSFR